MKYDLKVLDKYVEDGLLIRQKHPVHPLWIYNYSRYCTWNALWDDITIAARGFVVDEDGLLWARPFPKFFNMEQLPGLGIEIPKDEPFDIYEKRDGCCHGDVILITEDGEKTIKEICETNYNGKVLSFDINNNKAEFKEVEGVSIKDNINNWFEIEIENGTILKLTGNHKVWLPALNCYRRVDELDGIEEFLFYEK